MPTDEPTFAERAGPTLQWLKTFGVTFDFLPSYLITTCTTRLAPVGGGLALVEALGDWVEDNHVDVRYETSARGLIHDEDGAVVGIIAAGKDNRTTDLIAPSVILACGGFEGNPEMVWPLSSKVMKELSTWALPVLCSW